MSEEAQEIRESTLLANGMPLALDTSENSSFSRQVPGLQLAIDSTSLGEFKTCPRKYYYSIILGLQPKETSIHLAFGILMHGTVERYQHAKAAGEGHEDALALAIHWALKETWDKVLKRPSLSGDTYKNRLTLIRTCVWYLDQYGENDALETVVLANGKPAVELSFSFDSGYRSRLTGEPVLFCGHLDRLVHFNGEAYISDLKTSKSELGSYFWAQFNPSNQFGMYTLAGQVVWAQPVKGLIVDGAQVLVNSSRFARHLIQMDSARIQEWHRDAIWNVRLMEACASERYWPMNDKSCSMYGGCPFQPICARNPGSREIWLKQDYKRRVWDPLQRRGDI